MGTHGQKGPFGLKQTLTGRKASERPRGPDLVPTAADWSDWVGSMVTKHFGLVSGLFLAPREPKGPVLALSAPFGGPRGPRRAPGDQIWATLPPIGLTGLKSWLPHTLALYRASSGPPGTPKMPILGPKGPK